MFLQLLNYLYTIYSLQTVRKWWVWNILLEATEGASSKEKNYFLKELIERKKEKNEERKKNYAEQ
jgi:hypothetical protein